MPVAAINREETNAVTTTKATTGRRKKETAPDSTGLRHFSIDEVADLLGVSKRWLAGQVADRRIACTFIAGRTKFTAEHIRRISAAGEITPAAHSGRRVA